MKNSGEFILLVFILVMNGCTSPEYLPHHNDLGTNFNGSYIQVAMNRGVIKGELISADKDKLMILTGYNSDIVVIHRNEIINYELRYAKPAQYGMIIPTFIILPFMHGFYSVFTIPFNLIVSISTTVTGANAYRYRSWELPFEQLNMFARFPQGIPSSVHFSKIK